MATSRGKSIEYGWFKDKTTSKLVELTQKLLHFTKLRGLLHFLPQLSNIFTQIYLPYLWHFATLPSSPLTCGLEKKESLSSNPFQCILETFFVLIKKGHQIWSWLSFWSSWNMKYEGCQAFVADCQTWGKSQGVKSKQRRETHNKSKQKMKKNGEEDILWVVHFSCVYSSCWSFAGLRACYHLLSCI